MPAKMHGIIEKHIDMSKNECNFRERPPSRNAHVERVETGIFGREGRTYELLRNSGAPIGIVDHDGINGGWNSG
jgi:hypothetical protein